MFIIDFRIDLPYNRRQKAVWDKWTHIGKYEIDIRLKRNCDKLIHISAGYDHDPFFSGHFIIKFMTIGFEFFFSKDPMHE